MRRRTLARIGVLSAFALALAIAGCSSAKVLDDPIVTPRSQEADAVAELLRRLADALSTFDHESYSRFFSPDSSIVRGRTANPGPYDVRQSYRAIIDRSQRLIYQKRNKPLDLRLAIDRLRLDGNRAVVDGRLFRREKGVLQHVYAERFHLERVRGRWSIRFNRYWTLQSRIDGKLVRHDHAFWERADERVRRARVARDETSLLLALFDAHRFREALDLSLRLVSRHPKSARFWFAVGRSAESMRRWKVSIDAYRKASALNPDAPVPEAIRYQRIDRPLCHSLQRRAIECQVPSLFIGTRQICRQRMGQYIRDYERLSSWARMGCEELRQSWGARLREARLRTIERFRRKLQNYGIHFCAKVLPLSTEKVGCYYNTDVRSLSPLAHLKSLRELHLVKTSVSDLKPLYGLAQLRLLKLDRSPVPTREIEALKRALPQLRIIR
ncbi:MAG: hypothetical protein KC609_07470 [Myxococcales bacterium]|nr:hypothetical protein [Myxococcales bacterium]